MPVPKVVPQLDLAPSRKPIYRSFVAINLLGLFKSNQTSLLLDPLTSNEMLYDAIATKFYGQFHHQQDICRSGSGYYGRSLAALARSLTKSENVKSTATLIAVMGLFQFEASTSPTLMLYARPGNSDFMAAEFDLKQRISNSTSQSALLHVQGLSNLIETRGPHLHQSPVELQLFEWARMLIVSARFRGSFHLDLATQGTFLWCL